MVGFYSRFLRNSVEGDWKLMRPIAMQTERMIFSCSDSEAVAMSSEMMDSLLVPA